MACRIPNINVHRVLLGLAVLALSASSPAHGREDFLQAAQQLRTEYVRAVGELAAWCDTHQLPVQAQQTRAALTSTDPYKLYVWLPPKAVGDDHPPADAAPDVVQWHARFTRLKHEQADALFDLARRAAKGQRASLAYDLLILAIRENPDHEAIRRMMGQQKFKGQWCTAYELRKLRAGQVWHERFGWIPQAHVARYEQGQRFVAGKWISAEADARLHHAIVSGWDIETEHYTIRTDLSLEAGAALGVKLERLYRVWQQLFVRYYATEAQVTAAFEGRSRGGADLPRHKVVYFRDRDDYNRSLKASVPGIEKSIGIFLSHMGRAYFFAGQDDGDRTLYHEATHQLFHESRPVVADVGARGNFWIVEGIAMLMESLRYEQGFCVVGGVDDERLYAAQYRLLVDKFYVPLAEFTAFNRERLQQDPRIATLYSQAAGLTHFLVFHDQGHYRDALVAYLSTIYNGRDTPDTLARLVDTDYPQLDAQYREFLRQVDRDRAAHASAKSP